MPKFKFFPQQPAFFQVSGVLLIIALSLFPIFYNTIKYSFPIGYAGMYAQFAEQIANENFKLPMQIEFYGSGGVPAAFPPLGMYLLALNLKMGGPLWSYIRFLPALLSAFALLALFLLVREITASKAIGLITIVLASSSPYLYASHTWAAGIVRGLAYTLGLFFFYYFVRATRYHSKKESILAGVLLGLTVLTHLSYAFFFVLWSSIWVIVNSKKEIWTRAIWIGSIAALVSLPWVLLIVYRHGWHVFLNALGSHDTLSLFKTSNGFTSLFNIFSISLSEIVKQPVLASMALIGLAYGIRQKRWFLLSACIITPLFSLESRRFIIVLGCIFSAIAIYGIATQLIKLAQRYQRLSLLAAYGLTAIIVGAIYINGLQSILSQKPSLTSPLLETAEYIKTNSAAESLYLILADHHEAEWFPFLAKRTPLFAFWGAEWNGNINSLRTGLYASMECGRNADMKCLEQAIQNTGSSPQYLVVMKRRYRSFIDSSKRTT